MSGIKIVCPIANSNNWKYIATDFGTYSLRYSRVDNPDPGNTADWDYSHPVQIVPYAGGFSPTITAAGSTTLPSALGTVNSVTLQGPTGYSGYQWLKNSANISGATSRTYSATTEGNYTLTVSQVEGGCDSDASLPIFVSVGNDPGSPDWSD